MTKPLSDAGPLLLSWRARVLWWRTRVFLSWLMIRTHAINLTARVLFVVLLPFGRGEGVLIWAVNGHDRLLQESDEKRRQLEAMLDDAERQ
jgi:hypothetical protein